jgi:hypothetical protein
MRWLRDILSSAKVGTNFADKLCGYSSLADSAMEFVLLVLFSDINEVNTRKFKFIVFH